MGAKILASVASGAGSGPAHPTQSRASPKVWYLLLLVMEINVDVLRMTGTVHNSLHVHFTPLVGILVAEGRWPVLNVRVNLASVLLPTARLGSPRCIFWHPWLLTFPG